MDHSPIVEALRSAAAYWIFSALIQTMPTPQEGERWYGWLYNFSQALGANLKLIGQKRGGDTQG
jgi:hypothetical protein